VVDEHGSLDALVNNAGIVGSQALLGDYDIDEWKRIIDVNINGVFYDLKFGLSQMAKQEKGGSIVNMASTAAFRGIKNLGPYTPAKFAVRGLTHAAAVEYADKKIRVNAIGPTGVETPMIQGWIESMPDRDVAVGAVTRTNALPGLPQPSDIAAACAFLLSEEARYITGHTLPVDAGSLSRVANSPEM
jgi:NAD(P)-dependent dehydrogenase (short-subunit alcohol dehydrogenase family)